MKSNSRRRRQMIKRQPPTRLVLESLESRNLLSNGLTDQALALVPDSAVTARAVQTGNWSNPATWQNGVVPAAGANVLIPSALSVTVDTTTSQVHTIRVDGTLQFATNVNTNLLVDTLVVNEDGSLVIGTAAMPIDAQHRATVTFVSNGPINRVWDPLGLSRGLLALGSVTMYGATTTPYLALSQNALAGDTTLTLAETPTNWQVGDQIILGGTFAKWNQDENLRIQSIQGTQVTVNVPIAYNHTASNGVPVYITDVTRNIVFQSQDASVIGNRGHAMFMNNSTSIHYVEFLGLDRSDKSEVVNDPQLDSHGHLMRGTGTNPRDRYSVNFYEIDAHPGTAPAIVDGSTVVGSPGWGFVNHSSNVNFTNDVAFNVSGAAFVTEAGDETGSFASDLAIHSLGTGSEDFYDPIRVRRQDWAHEGDGFWMQGNGVSVQNNVAIGLAAAGYYYFNKPYTLPIQHVARSDAPLTGFQNNLAESCDYGAFLRYETHGGTIDGLTTHDCITGYKQQYCRDITLENSQLYGSSFSDYGIFLAVESAQGFVARNDTVAGFPVGIRFAEDYDQTLIGGVWDNVHNIEIPTSITSSRRITISNPTFAQNGRPNHFDIYWVETFQDVFTRDINAFFGPDTVLYNNNQLFAPWQSANYVPFPDQRSRNPLLPPFLIGMTNQQLLSLYGLAVGGVVTPTRLTSGPVTNGSMGAVVTYPSAVKLASPWKTRQLVGYQLVYRVNGHLFTSPQLYNLHLGWNAITVTVNGSRRTLFVLGEL